MGEEEKEKVGIGLRSLLHGTHSDTYTVRDILFVLTAVNILRPLVRTVSHELLLFFSLICRLSRLSLTRHGLPINPSWQHRIRVRASSRDLSHFTCQGSAVVYHPMYFPTCFLCLARLHKLDQK